MTRRVPRWNRGQGMIVRLGRVRIIVWAAVRMPSAARRGVVGLAPAVSIDGDRYGVRLRLGRGTLDSDRSEIPTSTLRIVRLPFRSALFLRRGVLSRGCAR